MPDWCNNYLTVNGSEEEVNRFFSEVKRTYKDDKGKEVTDVLSFESHVPPKSADWYNENIKNWGTKWDASNASMHSEDVIKHDDGSGYIQYSFSTAWGPPCNWLQKVVALFPTLEFDLEYDEGGNDNYGTYNGKEGELTQTKMTKVQHLEENNLDYQTCMEKIKKMSQEDLIKFFSMIKNFTEFIEEVEEGREDSELPFERDFWPIAGTIVKAIAVESAPLFINVDWGDDEFNEAFKNKLKGE